jgi:hypothetical protein
MRKLAVLVAMLGSLAWSSAAFAVVDESKDLPVQDEHGDVPSGTLTIKTETGKTIATSEIKNGKAHVDLHSKEVTKHTKVIVIVHNDQTNETHSKKTTLEGFFTIGFASTAAAGTAGASTNGPANGGSFVATPVPGKIHMSFTVGASSITGLPTTSSSGFFSGNTNDAFGTLIGGSVFDDFMTFGSAPGPFGSFVLSAGVVVDTTDSFLQEQGTCGGAPCDNSIRVLEVNYIGELKLTTPISDDNTINGYVGAGVAHFSPMGMPTGLGGPAFVGTATTEAYRVGWGVDHRFDQNWSAGIKVGFQWTGPTTYNTTLAGEHFHFGYKDEYLTALVLTYTPSDIRLKRDIVEVDRLNNGVGLYRYRYIWNDQEYVGVMAQEVAAIVPEAVVMEPNGYLGVNYDRLGLKMQTLEQWQATHRVAAPADIAAP